MGVTRDSRRRTPRGQSRRFLPPDPRVDPPFLLTPQLAFRLAVLGLVVLGVFAVLFLRLWALQVLAGDKYRAVAEDNRVRTLTLLAPRGPIVDRNGKVLVSNVAAQSLELWPADLPKRWPAERRELRALARITGVPVRTIVQRIKAHGADPLTPIVLAQRLRRDQVFYLDEHAGEFPGAKIAHTWVRQYPDGPLLAQVLGYVGQISPDQYKQLRKRGYSANTTIGQAGVEATYDRYMRGRDGSAQLTVDSLGRPTSAERVAIPPHAGHTLRLTIDASLQRAAEQGIRTGIQVAKANGHGNADGGAIVALDPRNGDVLAMASNPTYDPSVWTGHANARALAPLLDAQAAKQDNYPGLNRAIAGEYPPGSTFKPVTALAAMQTGLLSPTQSLLCSSVYDGYGQFFHNYVPSNSWITLRTALAESCDTYFYQVGAMFYRLPASRGQPLQSWAARFGLGQSPKLDIPGATTGVIPTPQWRCKLNGGPPCNTINRIWLPGYSIQLAIGQGDVTVTPLQMARFYALLANGGKLVTPHLADDVQTTSGVRVRGFATRTRHVQLNPAGLAVVRQGLYEATHSAIGTSSGVFGTFPVAVSGKTGTAEHILNGRIEDEAWWCGYAPSNHPTIALCAMIENGGFGGVSAAPAALKVLQRYFHVKPTSISAHVTD